ncbi:MAG TPA: ATP-grasp domain-containing protein [Acidiferrobacteraceae bacterium]|nr:ATP-grasp domain-containing protein [Acidiferrobacteraceae bacterium]
MTLAKQNPVLRRVLFISPHGSYRAAPFVAAAHELSLQPIIASWGKYSIVSDFAQGLWLPPQDTNAALSVIQDDAHRRGPFVAVVGTDDSTTELAAMACARLGIPHNPIDGVRIARRKDLARQRLRQAGVKIPRFWVIDLNRPLSGQMLGITYPCVVKPVDLSASRGVIRADDPGALRQAISRVQSLLQTENDAVQRDRLLVEAYIPGEEIAFEGMLWDGDIQTLAIFDKPDPLEGPYFEESYYVTPSRLDPMQLQAVAETVSQACAAYGLRQGPIHAECRINPQGVWIVEVAARTLGGLCARLLEWRTGKSLEALVLNQALGQRMGDVRVEGGAGVLMIPVPAAGILRRVEGIGRAEAVACIDEVVIQQRDGYELVPLPEGGSYLGFIFASGPGPVEVEAALRKAHRALNIVIAPLWRGAVVN